MISETVRVLKPGEKLIITMDLVGDEHEYEEIVRLTGLTLRHNIDHSIPRERRHNHPYDVVGFVLEKV